MLDLLIKATFSHFILVGEFSIFTVFGLEFSNAFIIAFLVALLDLFGGFLLAVG
jgi:hypothetical protein